MKESAIAQLLNGSSIEEARVVINVCDKNGSVTKVTLQKPDDLFNDAVAAGKVINLVFANWKIFTVIFDSIEDEDGQFVIYVRAIGAPDNLYGFPFEKLIGFFVH